MYYVRTWFREKGYLVSLDEGPFDLYFAQLIVHEIGADASMPRGMGRVTVERAKIIHEREVR